MDGYVTNLNLRLGSTAVANEPALALVDTNSFWIHGYFRENYIAGISEGNRAIVTLMSYPEKTARRRCGTAWAGVSPRRMAAPVKTCSQTSIPLLSG